MSFGNFCHSSPPISHTTANFVMGRRSPLALLMIRSGRPSGNDGIGRLQCLLYSWIVIARGRDMVRAGLYVLVASTGAAFVARAGSAQADHRPSPAVQVTIDAAQRFQIIDGFGSSVRLFDDPHLTEPHERATGSGAVVLTTAQEDEILDRKSVV